MHRVAQHQALLDAAFANDPCHFLRDVQEGHAGRQVKRQVFGLGFHGRIVAWQQWPRTACRAFSDQAYSLSLWEGTLRLPGKANNLPRSSVYWAVVSSPPTAIQALPGASNRESMSFDPHRVGQLFNGGSPGGGGSIAEYPRDPGG